MGSALRVLGRAGIVPDFHIELETAPSTSDLLREIGDSALLSRVTLLASNGVAPAVLQLFGRAYHFVREDSLSTKLLGGEVEPVPACYPVVGNAALGIAVTLGFHRVTFLGVDFGYRDPERHHAAGTIYIDEESGKARAFADVGMAHLDLLNLNYADTRHRLVSTTGEELLAEDILRTSHARMEHFLANDRSIRLRQCGTGARLSGAENVLPKDFDPAAYAGNPAPALRELENRFEPPPLTAESYAERMQALAQSYEALARALRRLFERPSPGVARYACLVAEAWDAVTASQSQAPALVSLVTGIFTSYFKASIERSLMTRSEEEQGRYLALAQAHFTALLDDISSALEPFRSAPPADVASRHIAE
jgi:hypothetical protein